MSSQLSLVPSPHSTHFVFISTNENGGCPCSVSVVSTMCTHCRIKAAPPYCNLRFKHGIGTRPEVSLTTLTLMLQSQFVVLLLITQISVCVLTGIHRQNETGGGVSLCETRYTSPGCEPTSRQSFCLSDRGGAASAFIGV